MFSGLFLCDPGSGKETKRYQDKEGKDRICFQVENLDPFQQSDNDIRKDEQKDKLENDDSNGKEKVFRISKPKEEFPDSSKIS